MTITNSFFVAGRFTLPQYQVRFYDQLVGYKVNEGILNIHQKPMTATVCRMMCAANPFCTGMNWQPGQGQTLDQGHGLCEEFSPMAWWEFLEPVTGVLVCTKVE